MIQVELFTGIVGTGKLLNILSHIDDINMMMNEIQSKKPCFVSLNVINIFVKLNLLQTDLSFSFARRFNWENVSSKSNANAM